jgi:hypothetical protein
MEDKVFLERRRPSDYYVNYVNGTKTIPFKWNGAKLGRAYDVRAVPREVFDELNMSGDCIRNGELVVSDKQPNKEEILDEILEIETIMENTHTHDEVLAILNGNVNKMKATLKKVTVQSEKAFIADIAETIKDDLSGAKTDFIKAWVKGELETE